MHSPIFSLEIFPPNPRGQMETESAQALTAETERRMQHDAVCHVLDGLSKVDPDFISVTYGYRSVHDRTLTPRMTAAIHQDYGINAIAHLTAFYSTRRDVDEALRQFHEAGVCAVLALRGDLIKGEEPCGEFRHASDLVAYIRQSDPSLPVFGACYPEGHMECKTLAEDVTNLKRKVDAGASHLLSQLFYDNDDFYRFLDAARSAGVDVPIEAGIMPPVSAKSVRGMTSGNRTCIPVRLERMLERWGDDPEAMRQAGIVYASEQIADLVARGVDGIHLYTMNRSKTTQAIWQNVHGLFKRNA